jgi:hypothetical protein
VAVEEKFGPLMPKLRNFFKSKLEVWNEFPPFEKMWYTDTLDIMFTLYSVFHVICLWSVDKNNNILNRMQLNCFTKESRARNHEVSGFNCIIG